MVEADHPENPANLVFDNVTKKNQHIIKFMSEHVLDENIQTLMKQVAIDYPRYDVPMKNESLALVKSIMETGQTPQTAPQEPSIEETFIDEIDESLSKYTSTDIFFETGIPSKMGVFSDSYAKWRDKGGKHKDEVSDNASSTKQKKPMSKTMQRWIAKQEAKKAGAVVVTDAVGEADQTVLKLAGVYK